MLTGKPQKPSILGLAQLRAMLRRQAKRESRVHRTAQGGRAGVLSLLARFPIGDEIQLQTPSGLALVARVTGHTRKDIEISSLPRMYVGSTLISRNVELRMRNVPLLTVLRPVREIRPK